MQAGDFNGIYDSIMMIFWNLIIVVFGAGLLVGWLIWG